MERPRKYTTYRVGDKKIGDMSRAELILAARMFCAAASNEGLRNFLMDVADSSIGTQYTEGFTTAELVDALKRREGVECVVVAPYEPRTVLLEGPALVLVVKD